MKGNGRIPVVVLAGFLGSGKTTLLNNLIQQADGERIVALVNDFGALNIDADLVVGVEGSTVSFANGCLCCTIHDDLAKECLNILKSAERPDLVLIELSGVSDPEPVMNTFLETDLKPFFELSAVVTVVDSVGWQTLGDEMTQLTHAQVQGADLVVLSKTDAASAQTVSETINALTALTDNAQIIAAPKGRLPLGLLMDQSFVHDVPSTGTRTSHGLSSTHWTHADAPMSLPSIEAFINAQPPGLVRVKGFLWLEELPNLKFLLQAVGSRYDITCLGTWDDETPQTRLVLIGIPDAIQGQSLEKQLETCVSKGDDTASPILRLMKRIAPDFLDRPAA